MIYFYIYYLNLFKIFLLYLFYIYYTPIRLCNTTVQFLWNQTSTILFNTIKVLCKYGLYYYTKSTYKLSTIAFKYMARTSQHPSYLFLFSPVCFSIFNLGQKLVFCHGLSVLMCTNSRFVAGTLSDSPVIITKMLPQLEWKMHIQ